LGNDHAVPLSDFGQTAGHRAVVTEDAIAMQLNPFGEAAPDVIEREGALRMARDLHALPGGQVVVNFAAGFANLVLHRVDFGLEVDLMFIGMIFQILQAALQFQDRFFELKRLNVHR
jgi:hypothetical protein